MRSSRNAWGGFFPVVLGQRVGRKKEREGQGVGLRLGWEFRFWIPISGTTGIRNSASENGIPELSGGKNPKIYGGNRFRHSKKKKKKAGTFFSDRNRKRNRKNRLKKTTGIRNSAEFRRNSQPRPRRRPSSGDDALRAVAPLRPDRPPPPSAPLPPLHRRLPSASPLLSVQGGRASGRVFPWLSEATST